MSDIKLLENNDIGVLQFKNVNIDMRKLKACKDIIKHFKAKYKPITKNLGKLDN